MLFPRFRPLDGAGARTSASSLWEMDLARRGWIGEAELASQLEGDLDGPGEEEGALLRLVESRPRLLL